MICPHCNRSLPTVTKRQLEILRLLSLGDKEIAARLGISPQTVKNHLLGIRQEMGHLSRTGLVVTALKRGWLKLDEIILPVGGNGESQSG